MKALQWQNRKPAKARQINLVSRRPWSEKNSSQNLVNLVNPGNFDEQKEVEIVTGKPVQTASKSDVGYSQVSRQENAPKAEGNLCMQQLQKERDKIENLTTPLVQGNLCKV